MRPITAGFRSALVWTLLCATEALPLARAAPNELGHPVVRDFPPGKSGFAHHPCQAITQDAAGFIYVANSTYLRCYDGASWRVIPVPTESAGVRKFAVAADGTIYAGGANLIGYLRGAGDSAEYVSLADRLPPEARNCDDIFDVLAVGNTVCFADEEKILIWRDGRFTVVPCPTPPNSRGARLHRVGVAVYVTALARGLLRLADDRLEVVADDPVLRENQIISVEAGEGGGLLLLTARRGFFQLAAGKIAPQPTEANRWLAGKGILRAQRLTDGGLAVVFDAVSGDGGMRFAADGTYLGPIDNSIGLYVKTLRDLFCDREGGLWMGSETGLFRLAWPSAVTVFDAVNGLGQGAVADVTRHEGVLFAATTEGVYRLAASNETGRSARFERVNRGPAYALVSHPGGLLVLGYAEVLVRSAAGFTAVAKVPAGGGSMFISKSDPARVWIETAHGVQSLRHETAGWRDEGPAGDNAESRRDKPAATDLARLHLPQLARETAGAVLRVRDEAEGGSPVRWIGGAKGLVRVDLLRGFPNPVPFAARLTATGVRENEQLPPEHAALKFDYVALRHQIANAVAYQTRLVGREAFWSAWSAARERTFTNLPAGDYHFEVRARDADGLLSAPASLGFAVLPPWWFTGWAILGYGAAGAGVFAGLVWFRTRALHRRAEKLESLVAERTAELARQNTELIRLNRLELDEKISARLAEEKARLEVLRYQLNPHFLFNTLASISSSLPAGPTTARTMVERLAEFCRLTLHRADERDWTTLGGEMKLLRAYLEIEQSRWGDLLDVEIACERALEEEQLPHFLLLPLVENALKYGRATSPDRVGVRLLASRGSDGALILEVANTGEWIEPATKKTVSSLGIGLDNLRERLIRHYPRAHKVEIAHAAGWVTVTLRILRPKLG